VSTERELPSARVERILPARQETVYDAWLDEQSLKAFMCPAPGEATEVKVEPRIGGSLRVVMTFPDRRTEITGEFVALDRPERLSFTWRTDHGDPGSIVTILLAAHGEDQTQMTIIHSRQPPALVPGYRTGWTSIAGRLADHLTD
jgi:uncharacterized protein YndB with AHSA1/START domain